MGQSGALQGVASLDLSGQESIQELYFVHQAQIGTWQMKLSGNPDRLTPMSSLLSAPTLRLP